MCNYCQTSALFCNSSCYNSRWRVQRICYDCNGNIHVIVTNGCNSRELTCGAWQGNTGIGETTATNGYGCRCGATANATTQTGNGYCAGYGAYTYGNGRSCGCGYGTAL